MMSYDSYNDATYYFADTDITAETIEKWRQEADCRATLRSGQYLRSRDLLTISVATSVATES